MPRDFLKTSDWPTEELQALIESAVRFKTGKDRNQTLAGRSVALVFFNPSLRTRASMQVGVYELGGNAVVLEPGGTSWTLEHREGVVMDSDKTEHVAEFVRVLGRYCVAIGVRTFAALKNWEEERTDPILNAFAKYSEVPIINLESAMHHPCQALADMMTIREKRGLGRKKVLLTWAWHPKPLPMAVPNSFALAAAQIGHDLTIAHPQGYELDDELMEEIRRQAQAQEAGSRFQTTSTRHSTVPKSCMRRVGAARGSTARRTKTSQSASNIAATGLSMKRRWRARTTPSSCIVCRCGGM